MLRTGQGRAKANEMIWYAYEKINMRIQVEQKKHISVCELCARWFTAGKIPCQWKMCTITANVSERHTLPNKKSKSYVYKQKRRKKKVAKVVAQKCRRADARILFAAEKAGVHTRHTH